MPFTAFPTRSIAGRSMMEAQNHRLRQDVGQQQMQRYDDERQQDEALRSALSQVSPSASPEEFQATIAQRLAGVPGAGKSVLGLIQAGQSARAAAAGEADERNWQRERFGMELDQKRELGRESLGQKRELAQMQHDLGMQRIAASRARGGGGGGGRRYRDPEDVVMGLVARGKFKEARAIATAKGVDIPPEVFARAERDDGYRTLIETYEGDSAGFRRASDAYDQSGDLNAAFKAGGPGVSGSGRAPAVARPPADVQTMEWMVDQGIARDPQDAFSQFRGLRGAANPQQTARQMTDAWARTQLNVTEEQYAQTFQRFLAMLQTEEGGADPLGLVGEGGEEEDPLGIFSEEEE